MLGFHSFATAPFASQSERVHVLSILEGVGSACDARNTMGMALRVLVNASGGTQESGSSGNSRSIGEQTSSVMGIQMSGVIGLSVEEQSGTAETPALLFGAVPLRIVEMTLAQDQPPFARQRWEFVQTSTGSQWVPVQTGE